MRSPDEIREEVRQTKAMIEFSGSADLVINSIREARIEALKWVLNDSKKPVA